jgi:DNA/RNA-binding domain of Phe-tRNA-synthetase-like protein
MNFQHDAAIWRDFPGLVPGVLYAENITADAQDAQTSTGRYEKIAAGRLASGPESELPEIQAWRRAFAAMGLKPTQYRCASESLLRRFRKEGALPRLHLTFGGEVEHPSAGEVIFADQAGQAHARRWTNRQSGRSAVRGPTSKVLIVAEALHDGAANDVPELIAALAADIGEAWQAARPRTAILTATAPEFPGKP